MIDPRVRNACTSAKTAARDKLTARSAVSSSSFSFSGGGVGVFRRTGDNLQASTYIIIQGALV